MKKYLVAYPGMILAGTAIGAIAVLLQWLGNPPNFGLCVGCFIRDMAGGLGLHRFEAAQYIRPEVIGITLGATAAALCFRQWRARGGSSPLVHFVLGAFAMLGVLVFLGCPWRAVLRLGGGDLNGLIGLAGLAAGSAVAGLLARRGGFAGESRPAPVAAGLVFPIMMLLLLILVAGMVTSRFGFSLFVSETGVGAMRAPLWTALGLGALVGVVAQKTKFCLVGAFRNALLDREFKLLAGLLSMLAAVVIGNLIVGAFNPALKNAPFSHTAYAWSFLGMMLCGLAFTLGGGCPGRQLVRAGEGDGDAAVFCVGMLAGAGIWHNWNFTAAPDRMIEGVFVVGGPTAPAAIAVVIGLACCIVVGLSKKP